MSIAACADLVRRGDPDRFLAAMAAPPGARAVLFPLYAFNLEVARAPWVTAEPLIAEMRLQWWRDALAEIAGGAPVRRHEVATPLAQAIGPDEARLLDALVAARRRDIAGAPFPDAAALEAYIDATSGHLVWAAARALGARTGEGAVRDLAQAAGMANWLLAVPELSARGHSPLPDDRAPAVAALARGALARLARARAARGEIPAAAQPALLAGWRAGAILNRAATAPGRVAEGRVAESEFSRRFNILARTLSGRW
ncbi:phytoene synthase [Rhodovulum iodosum]|uniref:Phytoene synthase n=1 Tax=Rhodovulum iodosum TaxID=68291 RepID=A0ABV3XV88_9RHOB|nr:squalene/phytoene synthase family protein [Rhodovulum robiginosum]RSK33573.1 phytoene synthase [Rhodovulum robiginosum]